MTGRLKYVERSIDIHYEGEKINKKTAKKMEEQRQGITERNWSGLLEGVRQRAMEEKFWRP